MLTTLFKKIFVIIWITMISAWYGCECVVKPPCNGTFEFRLQDKLTGQDLLAGPNARYSLDSLKIMAGSGGDSSVPSPVVRVSGDTLSCYINGSSDTLFLTLNADDKDTLLLSFRHHKSTTCCPSGSRSVNRIVYNGTPAGTEGTIFLLEK